MGIHVEEADSRAVTFEIVRAEEVSNYEGDSGEEEVLVLDYGDSDGVLLLYGTPADREALLERLRQVIMWAGAPGER